MLEEQSESSRRMVPPATVRPLGGGPLVPSQFFGGKGTGTLMCGAILSGKGVAIGVGGGG